MGWVLKDGLKDKLDEFVKNKVNIRVNLRNSVKGKTGVRDFSIYRSVFYVFFNVS